MVIIWNMSPVRTKSDETNPNVPRTLCELTNHLSCVNCVRWSPEGKSLASCGDDAIIMIWQIKRQGGGGGGGAFGGPAHEQWGCVHMLRGHASDVLDLAWSPDRRHLASCSVDNTIVVWNARELPQKVSVIDGHAGMVKGLTWDPVGKFIASQSDDRSIRVWRTSDWKEARKVTEPFKNCSGTTHVLRLNWSPDGRYIVSAHALNNEGPTAQIIERGGDWKMGMDFVGHRKAVEVVRFNPQLFVKAGSKSRDYHGCLALGSKDRSLSIWLTNHKRPLVVIHDLFNDSVLDLSWSKGGYELLVCSTDGGVAYLSFSSKELGLRLSKQSLDDLYLRTSGFKRAEVAKSSSDSGMVLIENPEMLKLHPSVSESPAHSRAAGDASMTSDGKEGRGTATTTATAGGVVSSSVKTSSPIVTKQIETRTKEGKRRITPITLTTEPLPTSNMPLPFTSFSSSSPRQGRAVSANSAVSSSGVTPDRGGVGVAGEKGEGGASKKSASGSEHSTPKSCVDFPDDDRGTPPKPIAFEALSPNSIRGPTPSAGRGVAKSASSPALKSSTTSSKVGKKRSSADDDVITLPKAKKLKRKLGLGGAVGGATMQSPMRASASQQKLGLSSTATASDRHHRLAQLPPPKLESSFSVMVLDSAQCGSGHPSHEGAGPSEEGEGPAIIEVENGPDNAHCVISHRRGNGGGGGVAGSKVATWSASLPSPCLLAVASETVTAATHQDKSLSLLSTLTGRALLPPLPLTETCYGLRAEGAHVMAVTCSGHMTIWDACRMKSVLRNVSFSHLLASNKQPPDQILLTRDGLPVLKVGRSCYLYNADMEVWMDLGGAKEVSEIGGPLDFDFGGEPRARLYSPLETLQRSLGCHASSHKGDFPGRHGDAMVGGVLRQIHSVGGGSSDVRSRGGEGSSGPTLRYLESQISRSSCLASPGEYRHWCHAYVQYLVRNSMEARLREFCGQFSAPSTSGGPILGEGGGGEVVMGFRKDELLREFVGLVAKNHKLQRLYSELKEALDKQGGTVLL